MTQGERILWILSDGGTHSHHEFYGFCVLHSRISELRRRGHAIRCWRDGDNYLYQLVPSLSEPDAPQSLCEGDPGVSGSESDRAARQPEATDGGWDPSLAIGLPELEPSPLSRGAAEAPPGTDLLPRGPQSPVVLRQPTLWEAA